MNERSRVRILAPDAVWIFYVLICCQNCTVLFEKIKQTNKRREAKTSQI